MNLTKPRKTYTGTAARILKLVSGGCNQEQAAKAVGVDKSYVSQLCAEEDFQISVAEALKADMEKAIEIDNNYRDIEKILSDKLKQVTAYMVTPDAILRTLQFVNKAQSKTQPLVPNGHNGGTVINAQTVQIAVPGVIRDALFVTNPNNEIIEVNGESMVTLNANSMQEFVKSQNVQKPKPTMKRLSNEDKWSGL